MGVKMNKQEKIQIEVDKTLSLFDKKESLPPNPYLYTRIQQQLKEKSKKEFLLIDNLIKNRVGRNLWHKYFAKYAVDI